jgi:transcriptional regulator GlxA family with amidase domain
VVLVAFEGVQVLDLTGPASVFSTANHLRPGSYRVVIGSPRGGELVTDSAVALAGTVALRKVGGPIDTVLVAGGSEEAMVQAIVDGGVADWLREVAPGARRVGSVCTGAFALAAAGLLDKRRATTHWAACGLLEQLAPEARVDANAIYAIDGKVCTSAGVTAGIDLALALVEQDLGKAVAAELARWLVVFLRRPGGQSQFSAGLAAQAGASDRLAELVSWAVDHPEEDLSVPALAKRAGMSERNFSRVFARQTGQTPARFAERVRLDRARVYLQDTDWSLEQIAERSGFGSIDTLQRAFRKLLRVAPADYRRRFCARPPAA